jgi:hypothetical protein
MLGICVQTALSGTNTKILTNGYVSIDGLYIEYYDNGTPLFMATNYGNMSYIAPSSAGNIVRIIGNNFYNQEWTFNGINIIYFNPDNTWIEL